jgi:uncharacterized protein YdeI (YjbR/CyaY-like superfamily)
MLDTSRYPHAEARSRVELRAWLHADHPQHDGVWLVTHRKHTGASYVSQDEVLDELRDELLCFGWIDGVARKLDADRTMQLITPRRTHAWTASYRARAERLETEGRLADPGRRAIALAKGAGEWEAHLDGDALAIPAELGAVLDETTGARSWFGGAAPSHRRTVLRWIVKAQRPKVLAKRIATVAAMSGRGERIRNHCRVRRRRCHLLYDGRGVDTAEVPMCLKRRATLIRCIRSR